MPNSAVITDHQVAAVLGSYASMVDRVLSNPQRWLGMDEDPPPSAPFPARAFDALRDRAFGEQTPASPTWHEVPVRKRVSWWVNRIGISAGLAAAAPRFFGAIANRVPLQAALGAAAAGLAVCAAAREHGKTEPGDWVPLLGRVLFDRDLDPYTGDLPTADECDQQLAGASDEASDSDEGSGGLTDGARRAATTIWSLARALLSVDDLLDHRPRGGRLVRLFAQVPVVGVAGGWLDERGGIRAAATETIRLL